MIDLVVSETPTSTWNYHLREVVGGKKYLGGGAPPALCGAKLGWDTQIPLIAYGQRSHLPEKWCKRCREISEKKVDKPLAIV